MTASKMESLTTTLNFQEYSEFNLWVFRYYRDRNSRGDDGCLAIDEFDYKYSRFSGKFFPEITQGNWSKLLRIDSSYNIPLFFGLIGLQCIAATMAEERQIRDAFLEISGIRDVLQWDAFCKEMVAGEPVQDRIWKSLKDYLEREEKIYLKLPEKQKSGPHRYIRYPKQQVVLNRDDLKQFKPFLDDLHEKQQGQSISLADFRREVDRITHSFRRKNNRNQELLSSTERKIRLRQIFNYYNSDSWMSDELKKRTYDGISQASYTLIRENGNITILDSQNNTCSPRNVLRTSGHNGKYCFFRRDDVFPNEFTLVDYLEYNWEYIILYRKMVVFSNWRLGEEIPYHDDGQLGFRLICYGESGLVQPKFFLDYFRKSEVIRLVGLRIGRKNHFLENVGPQIETSEHYTVYKDNQRIEDYDPNNCSHGYYRVKCPNYSDVRFRIIRFSLDIFNDDIRREETLGYRLDNLKLSDLSHRMAGIKYINDDSFSDGQLHVNDWIRANTGQMVKNKRNRFINLIEKKHKYGN